MIKMQIHKLLKEKNKTVYWLSKQTGISQNSLGRIVKNQTSGINFDTLNKICNALDCQPCDLFEFTKD